jgi:PAS domain S-box-containing protein
MQASKGQQNKREERILVLAPTGRDAELTARFLGEAGLTAEVCGSLFELCREISENAGAVFLTGEALEPENVSILIDTLRRQPPWSDIPIIALTSGGGDNPANIDTLAALSEAGNVTLIERPVRMMTLGSALTSALRARRKQYEARAFLLAEIESKEELRESEERYRNLFNSIDEAFCVIEVIFDEKEKAVDYRFLEINPMFEQQTGLENVLGKTVREFIPNHDEYWFETYGRIALTGEAIRFENAASALNRWFDCYAFRIGNSESRKVAVLFKDVTARKQEEEERERLLKSAQEARRTAEEASRLKDEFLAIVSHELRTPLNSILGWTQMFRRQPLDNSIVERAFETIERNARAQNQLIEDLLDVSRIISGKVRLDIQPVKLTEIIEAALDSLRPAADARKISLRTILDEKIEPVSGDADRLQQIIWNLLSNAIKFTPHGGKVEVRLEQKNSHAQIIVADTGKGIERDFLPFVFDRFRQADSSSKRQYGGLGLGLSIVRQLTELHGGSVAVFSEGEGKGATFTVVLPLTSNIRRHEYQKAPTADKNGFSQNALTLAGTKVLLVDDDEDTRILLSMLLEQSSAAVKTASSVSEALEFLEAEAFDLLISDIEMPQQDGYDLIKFVRSMPQKRNIPAIAVTAYARNEDRLRAISYGYDMHVPKPVESAELLTIIESLVGRKS